MNSKSKDLTLNQNLNKNILPLNTNSYGDSNSIQHPLDTLISNEIKQIETKQNEIKLNEMTDLNEFQKKISMYEEMIESLFSSESAISTISFDTFNDSNFSNSALLELKDESSIKSFRQLEKHSDDRSIASTQLSLLEHPKFDTTLDLLDYSKVLPIVYSNDQLKERELSQTDYDSVQDITIINPLWEYGLFDLFYLILFLMDSLFVSFLLLRPFTWFEVIHGIHMTNAKTTSSIPYSLAVIPSLLRIILWGLIFFSQSNLLRQGICKHMILILYLQQAFQWLGFIIQTPLSISWIGKLIILIHTLVSMIVSKKLIDEWNSTTNNTNSTIINTNSKIADSNHTSISNVPTITQN